MFVLVDSNNFFVSCERLFRPQFLGAPTVVLSSNDGCAVARSNEAKALGVKMGEPLHVLRQRFRIIDAAASRMPVRQPNDLVVFSANFTLYGDISRRIGVVLARVTPKIEFYSIDEAFLDISQLDIRDPEAWGRALAERIQREVGVPVSVGIAPTKTLCKLAADYVKHHPETNGAYFLTATSPVLSAAPVKDVWGVGWRLAPRLKAEGVHTAADLARLRPQRAQQLMGVHGRRMAAELQGTPCIPLHTVHKPQEVISRGRQFGRDTSDIPVVSAAVARMANHAAAALRREGLLATRATIWLSTNCKKPGYTVYHRDVHFYTPTADTGLITRQLVRLLEQDFDSWHAWHKAEVTLWQLVRSDILQTDVFGTVRPEQHSRSQQVMAALDTINRRYGRHTLYYAAEDLSHDWYPRRSRASPNYTADWRELPVVVA